MKFSTAPAAIALLFLTACGGGNLQTNSSNNKSAPEPNTDLTTETATNNSIEDVNNPSENTTDSSAITDNTASNIETSIENPVVDETPITDSLVVEQPIEVDAIEDTSATTDTDSTSVNPVVELDTRPGPIETEDRTRPASGTFSSKSQTLKSNGEVLFPDAGPQSISTSRTASWPGLRYGDFLVINNGWNESLATYSEWYQQISLHTNDSGYGVMFEWDWGAESDTAGSIYSTKSYPEVIYGTKSAGERSGSYADTGLPVEIYDAPRFTIDYAYRYESRRSDSPSAGGTDSEFNIAIESFFHSSCNIQRSGNFATDNTVFEAMVWLKVGDRKPSGGGSVGVVTTSDGKSFDIYTKVAENPNYIAFVLQQEQSSGSIEYTELINYAMDNAPVYGIFQLQSTHCMANILMGTEIWHGAGTFHLDKYQIHRSY